MPIPFDSQREYYRTPFGAVEQETTVHLRVLAPRDLHSKYVELCVKYDYDYNWEYHKMVWCGNFDENCEIWECDFTPKRIGPRTELAAMLGHLRNPRLLGLFIIAFLGMGVAGVALATVIAQFISAFLCLRKLLSLKTVFVLHKSDLKINKRYLTGG